MNANEYAQLLDGIKARVLAARQRAAAAANSELVLLYWNVGRDILKRQGEQGWGAKVVDRLSGDLMREFPGMRGFSPRNLKYMLAFARTWTEESIVQSAIAQLTWTHNVVLLRALRLDPSQHPPPRRALTRPPDAASASRKERRCNFFGVSIVW